MARPDGRHVRRLALATALMLPGVVFVAPGTAGATVSAVTGSAFGYQAVNIVAVGDAATNPGPAPTVALPAGGTNTAPSARVDAGPAVIFSSGQLSVSTQGTTGASGSVTSSATITNVNASQNEVFTASNMSSRCSASASGVTASTTITSGSLATDSGDTDPTNSTPDHPEVIVPVPASPGPNTTFEGHIHIGNTTDTFTYVFNEQIFNSDGSITVNAGHQYLHGPNATGELIIGQSKCGVTQVAPITQRAPADFDGDGITDISVFRPATGQFLVRNQSAVTLGGSGDIPVPCDYNGDGRTDAAVFRPSQGAWYIQGQPTVFFGQDGDIPVPGYFDGDAPCDIAVFRPSSGAWLIQGQDPIFYGMSGDIPVPADYTGDGRDDVAVFRPSTGAWFVQGRPAVYLGGSGDVPVPGDYDGNGTADVAVFRSANGGWYRDGAPTVYLGGSGDIPVPGRYDADATTDVAVFRPSTGAWYIGNASPIFFGNSTDLPLPLPSAIRQSIH